ncbi:MAG: hypothetical protein GWP61_27315 [Chloroflexi bacterium]|jgi:hypothetical protein|nr:hypothetical protein [Chloroflexota bacterium]
MNPGSRLQNYPHILELSYQVADRLFSFFDPLISRLGYERVDRWLRPAEELSKRIIFDCQMCGQCVLHSTGMTCPMTCPKELRNGPCGGVRSNGHCEVIPEMKCIWVMAFERSKHMPAFGRDMMQLQPPVNHQLEGSSAWINILTGKHGELPAGWEDASPKPFIRIEEIDAWKPNLSQTVA